MGNKCLRPNLDDTDDFRGSNMGQRRHKRYKSGNLPQLESIQALQLINKESFITSLEQNHSSVPSSGASSNYRGSNRNSVDLGLAPSRSTSNSSTVGLGFPSMEHLFYNA